MKIVLGRKQRIENDRWLDAMEHIEELVSREELDSAVATAVSGIRRATGHTQALAIRSVKAVKKPISCAVCPQLTTALVS